LDGNDEHHEQANRLESEGWLDPITKCLLLSWSILYETLNTRFVNQLGCLEWFDHIARSGKTVLLEDTAYRKAVFDMPLSHPAPAGRPLSLFDKVLHGIIEDPNVSVSAMLTFDIRDFWEVCRKNDVELVGAPN